MNHTNLTIMDALVVDKFPIFWFYWVGTENPPFHNDVGSSDIVHVETEEGGHVNINLQSVPRHLPDQ